MTSLTTCGNDLILGINEKIIFIDKCSITKNMTLPQSDNMQLQNKDESKNIKSCKIQQIEISSNGLYFAVTTCGHKSVLLYIMNGDEWTLLSARNLSRTSSAITFTSESNAVLVCDKTGDCYLYDCINYNEPGKWILGHLSIVLDVRCTRDQKYIITSDRDEKIRVTNFPDCHEIECYCLGHNEYVAAITFLPTNPDIFLLSLSGDNTMKIWKYLQGKCVYEISIPAPGVKFSVKKINEFLCHIAVVVFQPNESLFIYELEQSGNSFISKRIAKFAFPSKILTNLCFWNDKLFLTFAFESHLYCEIIKYVNGTYTIENNNNLNAIIRESIGDLEITDVDVSTWFKKKFDNVSEYLERKKQRIEEKSANR